MTFKVFSSLVALSFCGLQAWGLPGLRLSPGLSEAQVMDREPQIRTRVRLSDLMPPESNGPTAPKDVLRTQRHILKSDRLSYDFFGSAGSRSIDFIFHHADESSSLRVE